MTADDKDRLRRIESLFDAALEYPPGKERDAFLREQCTADDGMLAEARRLLDGHERVSAAVPVAPEPLPQFGLWQAIRLLGRGGMGMVYLAERSDGEFQMTVAVKVVPLALASLDIEERFRRKRQFLASLDHPKIARLIDGGVTSAGLPYLVMEFVDGLAIDRFCDTRELDARARIELMRQVLEALTYVHGRQVIHRDLKASNILVDAAGNAKLLDFGTARLVDASGDAAITKSGVFAFTPEYASPEQVQGKPLTFATDIYSAGVLLRRLLTAPDAPLDAILSKSLRDNPEERYASAAEMDSDLARYLEGEPVLARRPRKLKWIAIVAAGIAIGAAASSWLHHNPPLPAPPSIAVLPFANVGGNPANIYFSDGLTGEITDSLARLKGLRVIARSSAFQFRGKEKDIRAVGRQLNVTHVLEGSVERSGDQVRIVARLDRVSDLSEIWSSTYERKGSDLFSVQSELAAGIASGLGTSVGVANPAKHVVRDAEARDAYMRGYYEADQLTPESLDKAEADFKRAINRDPQYALAYAGLASATWNRAVATASGDRTKAARERTVHLYRKALELDPGVGTARANLAMDAMQYDWDWGRAEREFQKVLANGSNSSADQSYGFLLIFEGRFAEAEEHLLRAQSLNPLGNVQINNLALDRDIEGRSEDARREYQRSLALHPGALYPRVMIDFIDIEEGKTQQPLADLKTLEPRYQAAPVFEAMALARAGRREEALRLIRPLEERSPDGSLSRSWFGMVYAYAGDEANTVKWLERSADQREFQAMYMFVHPAFKLLRNNPRFHALKKRMGLEH